MCRSCEGRGWKLVSPVRMVPVAEGTLKLRRRVCLDCIGSRPLVVSV